MESASSSGGQSGMVVLSYACLVFVLSYGCLVFARYPEGSQKGGILPFLSLYLSLSCFCVCFLFAFVLPCFCLCLVFALSSWRIPSTPTRPNLVFLSVWHVDLDRRTFFFHPTNIFLEKWRKTTRSCWRRQRGSRSCLVVSCGCLVLWWMAWQETQSHNPYVKLWFYSV